MSFDANLSDNDVTEMKYSSPECRDDSGHTSVGVVEIPKIFFFGTELPYFHSRMNRP